MNALFCELPSHRTFPLPEFTPTYENAQLGFLTSNMAPMSTFLRARWGELMGFVHFWARRYSTVNVVVGPVFDYDGDSFADDLDTIR